MNNPVSFILASTDHGMMILNRNDFHLINPNMAYGVGCQLLSKGCYDPEELSVIKDSLSKLASNRGTGVVMLDCGANIGVHTLELARFMTGWGQIEAFEAQERLFYALAGNIVLNNVENASATWAAVGSMSGTMLMPVPDYNRPASFGSLELRRSKNTEYIGQTVSYAKNDMRTVSVVSIDDLKLSRVDFIKIDVEGMEEEVLAGAKETINRCSPALFIEYLKSRKEVIRDFLLSRNYEIKEIGMNFLGTIGS